MKRNEHPEEDNHSSKKAKTETKKIEVADDAFDCIVCYKFMGGEIQSCGNGHLWCGTCDKQLEAKNGCPLCRNPTKARSLLAEKMASQMVPKCPNKCGFAGSDLKAHKLKCPKYPFICLSCKKKTKFTRDDIKGYVEHQKTKHAAKELDFKGPWQRSMGYNAIREISCGVRDQKPPFKYVERYITPGGEIFIKTVAERRDTKGPLTVRVFVCTLLVRSKAMFVPF